MEIYNQNAVQLVVAANKEIKMNYLSDTFVDDFVETRKSGWLPYRRGDAEAEREYNEKWVKLAKRIQERVRHADELLSAARIGETLCFEGSCPAGPTFSSFVVWDGTDECRKSILDDAARHAYHNAAQAWLVREKDNLGAICAAEMRMG